MTRQITIYGIKNCDTMKKARAWLDGHGVAYDFHDYKTAGIEKDKLKQWSDELGWETSLDLPDPNRHVVAGTCRQLAVGRKTDRSHHVFMAAERTMQGAVSRVPDHDVAIRLRLCTAGCRRQIAAAFRECDVVDRLRR